MWCEEVTDVFVSIVGQDDNLGDSVLRRGLVEALRSPGRTLHIFTGKNGDAYVEGVGVRDDDVRYISLRAWRRAALLTSLKRRTMIVFNAGEVVVEPSRAHLGWRELVLSSVARLRGGGAVHAGLGIRSPRYRGDLALRATLRVCRFVSWRDADSRNAIGRGGVLPDWAFALSREISGESSRGLLVVSMRGDRAMPSEAWCTAVKTISAREGLRICVLSQVVRDNERATQLHALLDAEELRLWDGASHRRHEEDVRRLYRDARYVVSDRLHALIIGVTEGALPLGLTTEENGKLARTLAPAGIGEVVEFVTDSAQGTALAECVAERRDAVLAAVTHARRRLMGLPWTSRARPAAGDPSHATDVARRGESPRSVSCVIPTHARPEFLAEALQSVVSQTTPAHEIIVVSDIEDEETQRVVHRVAANSAVPVRYLGPEAGRTGASWSRNRGATVADGTGIAFLDDDDRWAPNHLGDLIGAIGDADMAVSWIRVFSATDTFPGPAIEEGCTAADVVARNPGITGSNFLVRAEAFRAVGGFDTGLPVKNDTDFFFRFLRDGGTYAVLADRTVEQRKHDQGQLTGHGRRRADGVELYFRKHRGALTLSDRRYLRLNIHRLRRKAAGSQAGRIGHLLGAIWNYSPRQFIIDRRNRRHPSGYQMPETGAQAS
ncbi:hypothetical protein GCM10017576_08490 [Microbacterium barkeri]|uniref:Glycosyltransferase involved in cell wall biosynthesis n=1 Tax=Microbacterium barkeri TaxID=33917 RepID=A0A9W6H1F7_9MICO|nr:glycosyltransferase family A protein [Microbacterium barkeri]MDI6942720.1 glycosyltransferase family A protein [Microbacterium barkeri]GLJ60720.1 hypothetical protein GCM10017576_08490 [Microbacterium barkeri]